MKNLVFIRKFDNIDLVFVELDQCGFLLRIYRQESL